MLNNNSKKKILIVASTFYPINTPRSHRATELAKEFSKQGHNVTVLTPRNSQYHDAFEKKHSVTIKDLGKRKWKTFSLSGKGIVKLFERAAVRISNLLAEYPDIELKSMVRRALKNENGYDLIISVAVPYPVHWGVADVRTSRHPIAKVWVADCGDPYMGDTMDSFRKPFYFKYVERNFCKKADFLTVPTKGSIDGYYKEFHSKIKVIPQGFDFEETAGCNNKINNTVPTFAYSGGFIPGNRDPKELLEYLCSIDAPFKFIIYTNNENLVQPFIERSAGRIELRSYIPRNELICELRKMDFLVNFTNGTTLATPSKLIDYALAKNPVISIDTGNLDKTNVNNFLQGDYSNQYIIENIEQYNIKNVVQRFLSLV